MIAKTTVLRVLDQIGEHEAATTDNESSFVERCRSKFEADGTLAATTIVRLYEVLDALDARINARHGRWSDDLDDD